MGTIQKEESGQELSIEAVDECLGCKAMLKTQGDTAKEGDVGASA